MLNRRRPILAIGLLFVAFTFLTTPAFATCGPVTTYGLNTGAPSTVNWTDSSAWTPTGVPGTGTCDAVSTGLSRVIVVNSVIPNPLAGLLLNCSSCVIDIQAGGQLTIGGTGALKTAAIVKVNGGTLVVNTPAGDGGVIFETGTELHLLSGTIAGSGVINLDPGATLLYDSSSSATLDGITIKNDGFIILAPPSPTTLTLTNGAMIDNWATIEMLSSLDIGNGSGANQIKNNDVFQVTSGVSVGVDVALNHGGGAVDVQDNATLTLRGGGTGDGPFFIASGATLDFPSDTYTMLTGGTVDGAGTLSVSGGTLAIGGVTEPDHFHLSAGTLTGDGFLSIGKGFEWTGGTITGTGGSELQGAGYGTISGADGLMILDARTFNNYGSIAYTASTNPLQLQNGATLGTYGTFDIEVDGSLACDCAVPSLLKVAPNGVLSKGGGFGTFVIEPPVENTASIYSFNGTLQFTGGGTHNGTFYAFGNGKLQWNGSTTSFGSSSYVGGDGGIEFLSGDITLGGNYDVTGTTALTGAWVTIDAPAKTKDLDFSGSTVQLNADFTMTGGGSWTDGTVKGWGGAFKVDSGATLTVDGITGAPTLQETTMVNDGTVNYVSADGSLGYLTLVSANFTNNGLFDIQTDAPVIGEEVGVRSAVVTNSSSPSVFTNVGTLQKSADGGTTDFEPELENSGDVLALSGTLYVVNSFTQTGGSTVLGPGDIKANTLYLDGGVLRGSGTLDGNVENAAQVAPGSPSTVGTITITGDYTQTSSGTLSMKLSSSSSFDQLIVDGSAYLDGDFEATLIDGYAPADSTTFPVLTFASRSGAFAIEELPVYAPGGTFSSNYTPTAYQLTSHVAPASADLRLQMSGPSSVNAADPLSYTLTVDNLGPDTSGGTITIANTLPAGVTGASGSGTGWSCGAPIANVITCTTSTSLAMSQALPTLTISMTAPTSAGAITNSATLSSATPDPNSTNNNASVTTNVVAQADLSITKSGPTGVTSGQNITYTVTVTNNGPSTATGVLVSDPTPSPLGFVSNSGACVTAYPCSLGTLTAGQSATITSTYSTPPSFDGNVTNTATVSSTTGDPDTANNSASTTTNVGAQADLAVTKTGTTLTSPGQDITYTVTVTNNGPSPATNVIVSDPPPVGVAFLSNSGACTTPYPCNVGTLNSGQSATITSTYTVPGNYTGATIDNIASASSNTHDPDSSNDSAIATTNVVQQTDLSIVKSGPASVALGQTLVYTITVTNDGPANTAGVTVDDPTPSGLVFVSNSGACASAYPCNIGALTVGQSATITTTFDVPANYAGTSITNTATVSSTATELDATDNSSTAITTISASNTADLRIIKSAPDVAAPGSSIAFTITVTNDGPSAATGVVVTDPTPGGLAFTGNSGACTTPFPCHLGTLNVGQTASITATYVIAPNAVGTVTNTATVSSPTGDSSTANNSDSETVELSFECEPNPALLVTPADGATVSSPVSLTWNHSGATHSIVTITGGPQPVIIDTTATNVSVSLPSGEYTWTVRSFSHDGCESESAASTFTVCGNPVAPVASVVGLIASGQTYTVEWDEVEGASGYELQESTTDSFATVVTFPVGGTAKSFTKTATAPTAFYYRVRALFTTCTAAGPFAATARVVVVPPPAPNDPKPHVSVQSGSTQPVTFQLFIPGLPEGTTTFIATADKPWLSVTPMSGIITPAGLNVTVSTDPSSLSNGTWTGTIVVAYGPVSVAHTVASEATTAKIGSIPVSISIVTPVTPSPYATPNANAYVIPAVGHLSGSASNWFSDVRLANVSSIARQYLITFNNAGQVRQTSVDVDGGVTLALDDLVRNWYGFGALSDSTSGTLIIQALDGDGRVIDDPAIAQSTIVSSRTYAASATNAAAGTLGQFIPATRFGDFIGHSGAGASILSLQQVAQSASYRTNLGLAEAAGSPVQLMVSIFGANGARLTQVPVSLNGGEQRQLNSFIAQQGLTLPDGRIEVEVASGAGKVTAYASVVDNFTTDPLVVSGAALSANGPSKFIVPGVADLDTAVASWRTDVRVFNSSTAPQNATLTFHPSTDPSSSVSETVAIAPGEVKALDGILQSLFELHGVGGTLHVLGENGAPLVVTARTYNETESGTVGQFIPAVTDDETVGIADGSLHVVQAEESARYRTNFGVTEVSGHPVTVEVAVTLPDSKVTPIVQVPLAAYELRQIPILTELGLGTVYNARISVRVIDGEGRVTAYGSIIDRVTEDPTFVPAR